MSSIKIYLNGYKEYYGPNDRIEGRVDCFFRSEKTLRGIKVRVIGTEHTEWMDSESYYDSSSKSWKHRTRQFTGDNDVLFSEVLLFGPATGSQTMPAGTYNYPFSIPLPNELPSTFESTNGYLRYMVVAVVDRPMKFDLEDQIYFFVFSPINFNLKPANLQEPGTWTDDKTICCCCCASGPIEMDVSLPKRAYIPGETMPVSVKVSNLSNVSIESISAVLTQNLEYEVRSPSSKSRHDTENLCTAGSAGVGAHGEHEFVMNMVIPPTTDIPNLHGSKLFKVYYLLEIEAALPGCHSNLEIKIYPELGHIPHGSAGGYTGPQVAHPKSGPSYGNPNDGNYPPPRYANGSYPPSQPGATGYPPQPGTGYSPQPGYPSQPGSGYPSTGFPYPPGGDNTYPPSGPGYPPQPSMGFNIPTSSTNASGNQKEVYPPGPPSAPGESSHHNKAREAEESSSGQPSAPYEPPPPSYDDLSNRGSSYPTH